MSDPILAVKDAALVMTEALAKYTEVTGVTLAESDPRRLHLQAFVLLLAQQRQGIDFAGKQSLLRFVSDDWIDILAELWDEERIPPAPSTCTQRFHFPTGSSFAVQSVPAGVRVTDGTNIWRVVEDTTSEEPTAAIDVLVECVDNGSASNGVTAGQIDELVDPDLVPNCTGVENITTTTAGRDLEALEDFRERLRDVPESSSACGPRLAYEANALNASTEVADAVALGPDDAGDVAAYAPDPGEVFVFIIKGERDENGVLLSVAPEPDAGLITTVEDALSAEDVRPLTDFVTVQAPLWRDFDAIAEYKIGRGRASSAVAIQTAVEEAFEAYLLWQQSKVGRDINPSELIARLVNAGAKRVIVTEPVFSELMRDEAARCSYSSLVYTGVEDD